MKIYNWFIPAIMLASLCCQAEAQSKTGKKQPDVQQEASAVPVLELPLSGNVSIRFVPVKVIKNENIFFHFRYRRTTEYTHTSQDAKGKTISDAASLIEKVNVAGTLYDSETGTWYIPFCETEVTNAQYAAVMGTAPPAKGTENLPKVNVSATEVADFLNRLSILMYQNKEFMAAMARYNTGVTDGFYFRLPTPVEWEFAARGGCVTFEQDPSCFYSPRPYPEKKIAQYEIMFGGNKEPKVHDVKKRKPNHVKLYDMLGNVKEMCGPLNYFDQQEHGRSGGIPICGGCYQTPQDSKLDSLWNEAAPYSEKGEAYRSEYVGFRPIMGSTIRHKKMSFNAFSRFAIEYVNRPRDEEDNEALKTENNTLREQVNSQKKTIEKLTTEKTALHTELKNEKSEITRLRSQLATNEKELKNARVQAQDAGKKIKVLENEKSQLTADLSAIKQDVKNKKKQIAKLEEEKGQLNKRIQQLIDKGGKGPETLKAEIKRLQELVKENENKLTTFKSELEAALSREENYKKRAREAEARNAQVEAEIKLMNGVVVNLEGKIKELQASQNEQIEKLKGELEVAHRRVESERSRAESERRRADEAVAAVQYTTTLVHSTQVKRAQAGIMIISNSASEISYYMARKASRQESIAEIRASIIDDKDKNELIKSCEDGIKICNENIDLLTKDFLGGCELLADVPQDVVDAELQKRLNDLKAKYGVERFYQCLVIAADYYREFRKTKIPAPTAAMKEKLKKVSQPGK